ncbi:MAG: hypothetical protein IT285_08425 [Bdellovibrionales bacterium]|nr:hypothetical protein [Bdellovibrionales bacterium]
MSSAHSASELLPLAFDFYGLGRVERAGGDGAPAPTDERNPADAFLRPACASFSVHGLDGSALLHVFFEDDGDASPWCELGNLLASRLADLWAGLPSPPSLKRESDAVALAMRLAATPEAEIIRYLHLPGGAAGREIIVVTERDASLPGDAHA